MTKCGALWLKKSKKGTNFMSGILDLDKMPEGAKCNVIVFKNERKAGERAPDYIAYLSQSREEARSTKTGEGSRGDFFGDGDPEDDDIPF